jgi:hypothetical protein
MSVLDHPLSWTHLSDITKCVVYIQLLFVWRWCVCSWKCNMLLGSKWKQFMLHRLKVAGNSFWRKQMTLFGLRGDITHHSVITPGKCSCNKCNCFTFCCTASYHSDFIWLLLNETLPLTSVLVVWKSSIFRKRLHQYTRLLEQIWLRSNDVLLPQRYIQYIYNLRVP